MIRFREMSVREATAYMDAYVASLPSRHEWLTREVVANGLGETVLRTSDGLALLWAHIAAVMERDGEWRLRTPQSVDDLQPGPRPPWYQAQSQDELVVFTDGTLWLIELLGAHLARLVQQAVPESRWGLYRVPKSNRDVNQNTTVLLDVPEPGYYADPTSMVYGLFLGCLYYRQTYMDDPTLAGLYRSILALRLPD